MSRPPEHKLPLWMVRHIDRLKVHDQVDLQVNQQLLWLHSPAGDTVHVLQRTTSHPYQVRQIPVLVSLFLATFQAYDRIDCAVQKSSQKASDHSITGETGPGAMVLLGMTPQIGLDDCSLSPASLPGQIFSSKPL